jgi:hypothetical protein
MKVPDSTCIPRYLHSLIGVLKDLETASSKTTGHRRTLTMLAVYSHLKYYLLPAILSISTRLLHGKNRLSSKQIL